MKNDLLKKIDGVISKRSEMKDAEWEWEKARKKEDKAAELVLLEKFKAVERELKAAESALVLDIQSTYNIAPQQPDGKANRPTTPSGAMAWIDGAKVSWQPRLSAADFDVRRVTAADGSIHHVGVNTPADAAYTALDGSVVISYETLRSAASQNSPGILAQTLFHESQHYNRLITTGWSYREVEEEVAYSAVIAHLDAFELPQAWVDLQTVNLATNRSAIQAKKLTEYIVTPKEEGEFKAILDYEETKEAKLEEYYALLKAYVENERLSREAKPVNPRPDRSREGTPLVLRPERPSRGSEPPLASKADLALLARAVAMNACRKTFQMHDDTVSILGPGSKIDEAVLRREGLAGCDLDVYDAIIAMIRGPKGGPRVSISRLDALVADWNRRSVMPPSPGGGQRIPDTPSHDKPWDVYRRFRDGLR